MSKHSSTTPASKEQLAEFFMEEKPSYQRSLGHESPDDVDRSPRPPGRGREALTGLFLAIIVIAYLVANQGF